jgi:hypothetical protein
MPDVATPAAAPVRLQTSEPTPRAELAILITVWALIAHVGLVILFLGFKAWRPTDGEVVRYLAWIGLGALIALSIALLIQLSDRVGTKLQTRIGADGVSLDLDTDGPGSAGAA